MTDSQTPFYFGDALIKPDDNIIVIDHDERSVTPKVMAVLLCLIEQHNQTVSKGELSDKVWGNVVATDQSIARAIANLRIALGDSAKAPKYIKTVTKTGFKAIAPITMAAELSTLPEQRPVAESADIKGASIRKNKRFVLAVLFLFSLSFVYYLYSPKDSSSFQSTTYRSVELFSSEKQMRHPRFSHDGDQVIYVAQNNNDKELRKFDFNDETETTIYSAQNSQISHPVFTKDDRQILFFEKSESCGVKAMSLAESSVRNLMRCDATEISGGIDVSPDGKSVLVSLVDVDKDNHSLHLINLANGKATLLGSDNRYWFSPRYSPNGKLLAYLKQNQQTRLLQVEVLNLETNQTHVIPTKGGVAVQVFWSNSDDELFVAVSRSQNEGIWRYHLTSQQRSLVFAENMLDADYNATNGHFVHTKMEEDSDIWFKNVSQRDAMHNLLLDNKAEIFQAKLSPDGTKLAFSTLYKGSMSLHLTDNLTHSPLDKPLYRLDQGFINQIQWLDNGSLLLLASSDGQLSSTHITDKGEIKTLQCQSRPNSIVYLVMRDGGKICSAMDQQLLFYENNNVVDNIGEFSVSKVMQKGEDSIIFSKVNDPHLYQYQLFADAEQRVHDDLKVMFFGKNWHYDNGQIFFAKPVDGAKPAAVMQFDLFSKSFAEVGVFNINRGRLYDIDYDKSRTAIIYSKRSSEDYSINLLRAVPL